MKLLLCCVCGDPYVLYPPQKEGHGYLYWSQRLNDSLHPACLEAVTYQCKELYGIDLTPLQRLLGFENIEREYHEYRK